MLILFTEGNLKVQISVASNAMTFNGVWTHTCMVRNTYKVFVGKHEEKRPLVRPRRRCEDC